MTEDFHVIVIPLDIEDPKGDMTVECLDCGPLGVGTHAEAHALAVDHLAYHGVNVDHLRN